MSRSATGLIGERWRILFLFFGLGAVLLGLVARVTFLQVPGRFEARRTGEQWQKDVRSMPAPRGNVLDRKGSPLAYDRPVYEVRAEVKLDNDPADLQVLGQARTNLINHLIWALRRDPEASAATDWNRRQREILTRRIGRAADRARERGWTTDEKTLRLDFLVDSAIHHDLVLASLRVLDTRCRTRTEAQKAALKGRGYSFWLHVQSRFQRVYPQRELTTGVVGFLGPKNHPEKGDTDLRYPKAGLERLSSLSPGPQFEVPLWIDALRHPYWVMPQARPEPLELRTSLDLELQRHAQDELMAAVTSVRDRYDSSPEWAGMILLDVPTGEMRAAVSFVAGEDGENVLYGADAVTQQVFEPGSVVKPLHVAVGLQRGDYDWSTEIDTRPGYQLRYRRAVRTIRDDHDVVSPATPHRILLESSNIGAVQLGMMMGVEGIQDYLDFYEFGKATELPIPGQARGRKPKDLRTARPNNQQVYSAPSVLFGYEMHTTVAQVARAYLSMLSGRQRELRLVTGFERSGHSVEAPPATVGPRFISPEVIELIKRPLAGVAAGEENGTGHGLSSMLRDMGVPPWTMAGKTGTSEFLGEVTGPDGVQTRSMVRTASFAGFAPVDDPRFLVVCVVQKAGASRFYGGTYAAPAAGRLLLWALRDAAREPARRSSPGRPAQVSAGVGPAGASSPR